MNKPGKYSAYKESGVEWIGNIPVGWEVKKLKNISNINQNSLAENSHKDYKIEYVDIGNVNFEKGILKIESFLFKNAPSRARRRAKVNDSIISTVRTYLKAIDFVSEEKSKYVYSTGFAILEPMINLNPMFLSFFLKSNFFTNQVDLNSKGISYPAINSADLNNLLSVIPPKQEQIKIATFLDAKAEPLDKAIKQKQQLIELLKERRQILINDAVTKGLDKTVAMKDSGVEWIGNIPEHWEVKKLKYNLQLQNKKAKIDGKLVIALENIESFIGKYIETTSRYDGEDNLFQNNDILFGKLRPYLSKVYLCKSDGIAFGDLLTYRPKKHFNSQFSFYLLISAQLIKTVDSSTYGSKMPIASSSFINEMLICTPPNEEQIKIADYIENYNQKIEKAIDLQQQQINKLKEYKTTLIDSVVTGKVRVCDE